MELVFRDVSCKINIGEMVVIVGQLVAAVRLFLLGLRPLPTDQGWSASCSYAVQDAGTCELQGGRGAVAIWCGAARIASCVVSRAFAAGRSLVFSSLDAYRVWW